LAETDILYEVTDRIAWITINRPERMNALTQANLRVDFPAVWDRFNKDEDAWVAVVSGAGERAFCTGMDVREGAATPPPEPAPGQRASEAILVSPRVNEVWKPVIAAINGVCAGIGLQIMMDSDIAIASENASFADTRTSVGMMAAMGPVEMSRMIPLHELLRLVMTGRHGRMTAQRAYQIGMVSELVPPDELRAAAQRLAEAVLENAPAAVRLTKMAVWQGLNFGLAAAMENSARLLAENPTREDMIEGMRAFAEKRKPQWKLR
jgi:enoyl-CoA hydratase/carnithine racemase